MKVEIQKFLDQAGIKDAFYPGKRLVVPCQQSGQYKSHCVVLDWRDPERILLNVKPGLSSKDMEPAKLKKYPVCLQTPTYVEIEILDEADVANDDEDREEEEGKSSSGGTSKGQKKNLEDRSELSSLMSEAFTEVMEGKIPDMAKIVDMMVMGTQVAAEAFEKVFKKLVKQISHHKISATELLAQAGDFLTKVKPPEFLEPKDGEKYDVDYKYNREKNADIGFRLG